MRNRKLDEHVKETPAEKLARLHIDLRDVKETRVTLESSPARWVLRAWDHRQSGTFGSLGDTQSSTRRKATEQIARAIKRARTHKKQHTTMLSAEAMVPIPRGQPTTWPLRAALLVARERNMPWQAVAALLALERGQPWPEIYGRAQKSHEQIESERKKPMGK